MITPSRSIRIDDETADKLKHLAESHGDNPSQLIKKIIKAWLQGKYFSDYAPDTRKKVGK